MTNAVLQRLPVEAYLYHRKMSCVVEEIHRLGPMDLKIYRYLSKKVATVTRQLTKSINFRQKYIFDFISAFDIPVPVPDGANDDIFFSG